MKWRFWESEKRNEQDGYTEGLIRAQLERAKSGNKPKPDSTGIGGNCGLVVVSVFRFGRRDR